MVQIGKQDSAHEVRGDDMRAIRIGIVEDDATCAQQLVDYLNRYQKEFEQKFTVSLFTDGEQLIERYTPTYDILLMDIEMKHLNGIEAARAIRERDSSVVIIFVTAAPQYAISGYEVHALSYLLKPVPWFAFSQEIKRSIDALTTRSNDAILVDSNAKQIRVFLSDIVYIESVRHTIIIHTLEDLITITGTLKELEKQLAEHHFFRSNSCYLVNLKHVTGVQEQDSLMSNGERLRISRPRKKDFINALTTYIGGAR